MVKWRRFPRRYAASIVFPNARDLLLKLRTEEEAERQAKGKDVLAEKTEE